MSEEIPEDLPAPEKAEPGPGEAESERAAAESEAGDNEPEPDAAGKLPRTHDDDRSPADPHDWQDEWDRARWAP
ncbi:hypothetical protein D7D52_00530 [Nocardia yunnanensis]|uniref:Uncharacterized protein n=1 Tax=Nocardia yunnanensis TaxID=2382165 RepID=A0A386Z4P6_9NOCA|nr:hypothetical protein [Nocardia yunnanensis]AYF72610.1 hypothetical protein D7D52_00530 [Nocardia yunnanensis]